MNIRKLRRMAAAIPPNIETKNATETPEARLEAEFKAGKTEILDAVKTKADASVVLGIQTQLDAIDLQVKSIAEGKGGAGDQHQFAVKSVGQLFTESQEFQGAKSTDFLALRSHDGRIRSIIPQLFEGRKAAITTISVGTGTTGVQMPFRLPDVTGLPMQELRIRDLMTVRQMPFGNSFDYVKMVSRVNNASPQNESQAKAESTYTWTSASGSIKTLAHYVNISRQAVDDIPWIQSTINSELMYGLLIKEEAEILSGDGTGQHLTGLTTAATPYNTGLNVSGDTYLDQLRHAKLQARLAGLGTFAPDGIVLNPTDMHKIELIKTEEGGANKGLYIIGDPRTGPVIKLLWGLPVVESDSMPVGKFLVGAFATAAELIDRMQAFVEISYEHNLNFIQNMCTILCEERIGLAIRRSEALIYGTFS